MDQDPKRASLPRQWRCGTRGDRIQVAFFGPRGRHRQRLTLWAVEDRPYLGLFLGRSRSGKSPMPPNRFPHSSRYVTRGAGLYAGRK